jgi:hypothetical protein
MINVLYSKVCRLIGAATILDQSQDIDGPQKFATNSHHECSQNVACGISLASVDFSTCYHKLLFYQYTVEPLLSVLRLTVPLTGMQFLSTFSVWAELWADSRLYIDTRKENVKWASE